MLFAPKRAPTRTRLKTCGWRGKNHLRQTFAQNPTFAAVRRAFGHFLQGFVFPNPPSSIGMLLPYILFRGTICAGRRKLPLKRALKRS